MLKTMQSSNTSEKDYAVINDDYGDDDYDELLFQNGWPTK